MSGWEIHMKLVSVEMGTRQVVERAHNVLLTSYEKCPVPQCWTLLFTHYNQRPNALLKLLFWPLFWVLLLPPPERRCPPWKFLLPPRWPLKPLLPSRWPLEPLPPSRWPLKPPNPSRGPSSSGCSVATDSCQRRESCHFSCGEKFLFFTCFDFFYWTWLDKHEKNSALAATFKFLTIVLNKEMKNV